MFRRYWPKVSSFSASIFGGNELEAGHFGPKIEAEKDDSLGQYLQGVVRRHQSSLLDSTHPDFYKNHEIRVTLIYRHPTKENFLTPEANQCKISHVFPPQNYCSL
jgi:hypothetical protein